MNELITIPAQPAERCKFKRRQEVLFVGSSIMHPRRAVVIEHYDYKDAVRVEDCEGERIVTVADLVSQQEYDAARKAFLDAREAAELEASRVKMQPVIDMWKDGLRTAKEMADKTGEKPIRFVSQIKAVQRLGFVKGDL